MTSIEEVAAVLEHVLGPVADEAARQTGFVQRHRKLTGATFVQTLVLGWLQAPAATLGQLTQMAARLQVPLSCQGLDQRFTEAAAATLQTVLEAAVGQVVGAEPVAVPLLQRFTAVAVQDSTTLTLPAALAEQWPGCGNGQGGGTAAVKLQVRLDLGRGRLTGPALTAGRVPDQKAAGQLASLPAGALRVADLGYFSLAALAALTGQEVYWLSRLYPHTQLQDPAGTVLDLMRVLRRAGGGTVDRPVLLGRTERLPARLLAVRVPKEVAAQRRRRLRAVAREKGRPVSSWLLALARWTLLVTNVPVAQLSLPEALVLLRARWQIELVFKLWKQHGLLDEWRSARTWRILCEVYAKLLGLLVQHWCSVLGCWPAPDRSLVQAAQTVRASAVLLASAFAGLLPLPVVLEQICQCLQAGGRLNRRRRAPNTYQLLLDPALLADQLAEAA